MMYDFSSLGHLIGLGPAQPVWAPTFLILLLGWSLIWKGLALWHSARREQGWWFIIILLVNTAGLLELVYLFLVLKLKPSDVLIHTGMDRGHRKTEEHSE